MDLRNGWAVDTDALTKLWDLRWPGCPTVPYELRNVQDRWVRFHALPASKRYPETESEYGTVLHRHNTVLTELVTGSALLVVTAGYCDGPEPDVPGRPAETVAVHPDASYWTSTRVDDAPGTEHYLHQYVSRVSWSPGCVDPLLRDVAGEVVGNALLADPGLRWLYHPYAGGMDVLMPSHAERDVLRDRHHDWLSAHPGGL